ncbi:hypothetical protein [Thalassobacillus hwangdonensis]|uniref:Spore coat protein n=1 Tax=Thalassobacillus hwangdonensis TaxID=546108 RepID=A0ABW3KUR6_9BACI
MQHTPYFDPNLAYYHGEAQRDFGHHYNQHQDDRFFGGPFVGGLLGGLVGSALFPGPYYYPQYPPYGYYPYYPPYGGGYGYW